MTQLTLIAEGRAADTPGLAAGFAVRSLAVHKAPWDDTPDGPFITDLFTDPGFRRRGLGRALVARCLDAVHRSARRCAALRVESENAPAVRLYQSVGFRPYAPPDRRAAR